MKQRILTGILGGTFFLFVLWLGGIVFNISILILTIFAFKEITSFINVKFYSIISLIGILYIVLINFQSFNFEIIFSLFLIIGLIIIITSKNKVNYITFSFVIISASYLSLGFNYFLILRNTNGFLYSLYIIVAIWAADSVAYFSGKYFGQHKLWPSISPNKTIEGAFGGFLGTTAVTVMLSSLVNISISKAFLLGFIIFMASLIGDLAESAIKRSFTIKDSGDILPGHGGILDRFDSLLYVSIVIYILQKIHFL